MEIQDQKVDRRDRETIKDFEESKNERRERKRRVGSIEGEREG